MRGRTALVAGLVALLAGCGLPTPQGVQSAGEIDEQQEQAQRIENRPPGPIPGASPAQVVDGFLTAQGSPADDYAVARGFLAPGRSATWTAEEQGITVVQDGDRPDLAAAEPAPDTTRAEVTVPVTTIGLVRPDGSAEVTPEARGEHRYALERQAGGEWRISEFPAGLTLSESLRDSSLLPSTVQLLSPPADRLVPDLVRLPNDGELLRRLTARVVDGPSEGLRGSARTAAPEGTRVLRVSATPAEVTVDLSREVEVLGDTERRDLSAQLFWTLRGALRDVRALRLLVEGQPLRVGSDDGPQAEERFAALDPAGPGGDPPLALAVAEPGKTAVTLNEERVTTAAVLGEPVTVTDVVQNPGSRHIAALSTKDAQGLTTLLVADPPGGGLVPLVPLRRGATLVSPSWGDGTLGVWTLSTGSAPAVTVGGQGTPAVTVPVDGGLPALTGQSVLRVSRDGARVALVLRSPGAARGVLKVGRVERLDGRPRIRDLHEVAAATDSVLDVAWVDGTTLVALSELSGSSLAVRRPLLTLRVDGIGREAALLNTGTEQNSRTIAAYGSEVLIGAAVPGTGEATVYRRVTGSFVAQEPVPGLSRPRFPG